MHSIISIHNSMYATTNLPIVYVKSGDPLFDERILFSDSSSNLTGLYPADRVNLKVGELGLDEKAICQNHTQEYREKRSNEI